MTSGVSTDRLPTGHRQVVDADAKPGVGRIQENLGGWLSFSVMILKETVDRTRNLPRLPVGPTLTGLGAGRRSFPAL